MMECLADYISNSPRLLNLIPQCSNASIQIEFVKSASAFLQTQQINYKPDELFSHFTSFISSSMVSFGLKASMSYPSITAAFTKFRENRIQKKRIQKETLVGS